jgi:hypothetical protein
MIVASEIAQVIIAHAKITFDEMDVGIREIDKVIIQGMRTQNNKKLLSIKVATETALDAAITVPKKESKRTFRLCSIESIVSILQIYSPGKCLSTK